MAIPLLKEFRDFAMRGNVVDMAVGIIIGGAFGKIVSSLVNDIVMPPFGLLLNNIPFRDMCINLQNWHLISAGEAIEDPKAPIPTINLGAFFNTVIDFVIVAFAIFMVIRWMNRLLPAPVSSAPAPKKNCPYCQSSIPLVATRCPQCTSELPAGA
ncbi:MAG TPA: large conductance mechanosensitive channel protein MscL [Pirellulales bacterium]|jgi:large conductance mechanosensitive channel